jgi:hypothetical protein
MEALLMSHNAVETLLVRLRDWWRARTELGGVDRREVDRIAEELGMTADDLRDLVTRGPDAANLLHERMRVLGLSRADVEHAAHGLMRDLERTCACCNEKGTCDEDLKRRPDDPHWTDYCPNAVSLQSLAHLRKRTVA